jgi:hypothetical protein
MIQNLIKFSSFFKANLSEDAINSKLIFDDQGSVKDIKYHVTISSFIRGLVVYIRINDFQQILEITENVTIPIEIPSPIGSLGGTISVDNMIKTEVSMTADFKVDVSFGFFGNYNFVNHKCSYEASISDLKNNELSINDFKFLVLIGLIKSDKLIKDEELSLFNLFLKESNLSSEKQTYFMEILKSKEPSNIDFSIIKDNSLAVSLLEIMIDLAIKDGEVHENEIEYILNFCDKMNIDKKSTLERLKTNN